MGSISLSIPQSNLPNSTEDPKVSNNFTLLQTLLNGNLDASNISPSFVTPSVLGYRAMPANATAASGDWVVAAPDVTVTLPAPATSLSLAVTANSSVTPAHPVIVSGTNLSGKGFAATSSFVLGVPQASVILESDGTGWTCVTGGQDTGWLAISSFGGSASAGTPAASYRVCFDQVYLRGGFSLAGSIINGSTWATLPAGARPPVTSQIPCSPVNSATGNTGELVFMQVSTSGVLTLPVTVTPGGTVATMLGSFSVT